MTQKTLEPTSSTEREQLEQELAALSRRVPDAPPGEPAGHRVLIEPEMMPHKRGNIWIPDTVRDQHKAAAEKGRVVSIGINAFLGFGNGDPWCEAGDIVQFIRYAGKWIDVDGKPYVVVNDEDIHFVHDKSERDKFVQLSEEEQ